MRMKAFPITGFKIVIIVVIRMSSRKVVYLCAQEQILRAPPECFRNNYEGSRRAGFWTGSVCDSMHDLA